VIPMYVDLKGFLPQGAPRRGDAVTAQDVEAFVEATLSARGTRSAASFLDSEFHLSGEAGTLLFLFDSFDEIPAILSAPDQNSAVVNYASAISSFMRERRLCRGVVASREFRGAGGPCVAPLAH